MLQQVASSTEFLAKGCMMWEKQAIEHWQTTAGGRLSEEDAKARWEEWTSNKEEMGLIFDLKGPARKPLRLRVGTLDEVNFSLPVCPREADAAASERKEEG